jgi:MATE family multidrug resistance protein
MGVTDNIMVGKVGYSDLAAAGVSNSIFIMVVIVAIGMMIVGSPLISNANSTNNKFLVMSYLRSCIQVSFIISLISAIVLLFLVMNFEIFNQTSEVTALSKPYLGVIILSIFPLMFFIAVEQFTDGLQKTYISMFFNITALVLNIVLNWIFIYGNLGFEPMGLLGAGYATLLSRVYMGVGIWVAVNQLPHFKAYKIKLKLLSIHKNTFTKIVKQGIPSGMQFFFEVSAFSFSAIMIGWLGTVPLAAHNIAISLASVSYMMSSGFATGTSIRVGAAFGQRSIPEVRYAGIAGFVVVILFMLMSCMLFFIFNQELAYLYNTDTNVVAMASGLLILAALFQFSDGIQVVAMRALLGIQDIKVPTIITFVAYWVIAIPSGALLTFKFDMGANGIWVGLLIGLSIAAIMLMYRFFNKSSRLYFN